MLKVGLIGCGFMGAMHANCYKNIEGVDLVHFCDKAAKGEKIEKATLCDSASSLEFLMKEISFNA